jgi:hypothetical protein
MGEMNGIGQLNEQHLHHALKMHYATSPDQLEVQVEGWVVDVVQDSLLIEIQTGNFSAIKEKMAKLVAGHRIKLVYPIAVEKWLVKLPGKAGEAVSRRKSPKKECAVAVFEELVSFPVLLAEPNFSLECVLVQEEEVRRYVGRRRWYRNGWEAVEKRLITVLGHELYEGPAQMLKMLPADLPEAFTTANLADKLAIPRRLAQKMAYCLREMGAIHQIGKQCRANLYSK